MKDVLATSVEWRYISFILDIIAASPIVRCIIDTNTMNYNGSEKKNTRSRLVGVVIDLVVFFYTIMEVNNWRKITFPLRYGQAQ